VDRNRSRSKRNAVTNTANDVLAQQVIRRHVDRRTVFLLAHAQARQRAEIADIGRRPHKMNARRGARLVKVADTDAGMAGG
jgi:alpha-D-ribose 1-methylphosphonate 5-triphosphate synthase subunit PhnI